MEKPSPVPVQLRLSLVSESTVLQVGATRQEVVQLLAQLLASAVAEIDRCDLEVGDEPR